MALRGWLWKAHLQSRHGVFDKLDTIREWESASYEEVQSRQQSRLQELLDHAYENVPFYQQAFDDPPDADQMEKLPVLEKRDLRENFEQLKSRDIDSRNWYENHTGGSTGEPVSFVKDAESRAMNTATSILIESWGGRSLSDPKVKIWGAERDLRDVKGVKPRVRRWLKNRWTVNAYDLDDEAMERCISLINEKQPVVVHGYVESIDELSKYIKREEREVHSPQSVMTTAGTLYPDMRSRISSVFDAPVHNRYGSREVGLIACGCGQDEGLHVLPFNNYVEILDPDTGEPVAPGDSGEIVVTSMTNYSMPLIRYKIGDVGSMDKGSCRCGKPFQKLKNVRGRVTDHFITQEGGLVHPGYLRKELYEFDWINRYQIHQTSRDQVVFRFESTGRPEQVELYTIEESAQDLLGDDVSVQFEFPERIERSESGKYRFTMSDAVEKRH